MRRSEQHIALTLWPFLDILSCLAGALTVIIATVLVTEIVEDPAVSGPLNERLTQAKKENERRRAEIGHYQAYIRDKERQQADLQKAREAYMLTQQDIEDQLRREAMLVSLLRQKEDVERQIQELRDKYARQSAEIGAFRATNQGGVGTNVNDRIEVHFAGRGKDLKPVFVECNMEGIVIRAGHETSFVRIQNISASDEFHRVLNTVETTLGGTVIFLIRPLGVEAFEQAEEVAEQEGVRNGKLPIPGEGVIDLGPYGDQAAVPP
jgi:hypothetical protein